MFSKRSFMVLLFCCEATIEKEKKIIFFSLEEIRGGVKVMANIDFMIV